MVTFTDNQVQIITRALQENLNWCEAFGVSVDQKLGEILSLVKERLKSPIELDQGRPVLVKTRRFKSHMGSKGSFCYDEGEICYEGIFKFYSKYRDTCYIEDDEGRVHSEIVNNIQFLDRE
jgi:hypothetical protein